MKYITLAKLQEKLGGRGRTTLWNDVKEGRLPAPRKLGGRNYWLESEVDAVMEANSNSSSSS